jgi:hypothetical protein
MTTPGKKAILAMPRIKIPSSASGARREVQG